MHTIETLPMGAQMTQTKTARKTAPESPEASLFHRMLQQVDGARSPEKPAPTEALSIEQQLLAAMLQIQPGVSFADDSAAGAVTVAAEPMLLQQPLSTDGLPTMEPLSAKNPLSELRTEMTATFAQLRQAMVGQTVPGEAAVQTPVAAQPPVAAQTPVQTAEPIPAQTPQAPVQTPQAPVQTAELGGDTARPLSERLPTDTQTIAPKTEQLPLTPLAPTAKSDGVEEQTTNQKQTIPQTTPLFHEVKAVPVKVGEVDTTAGEVDVQIAKQLAPALRRGDTRVQIQLSPETLGTVTIEMTHSQDGSLHVMLSTGSERAQGILERASAGLQSLLTGHNQTLVQVEVQRQQESQPGNDQRGQQQQQQQQPQRDSQQHRQQTQDFLQRLRLGLSEPEAS